MQQVLVTGGCGFIGRQVCRDLLSSGYRVRALDALIEQVHGSGGGRSAPAGVDLVHADIRDRQAVAAALEGVDGVVHLAAEVGVGQSMYEIARYVGANDLGTAVLLECLIDRPVQRLVVASSMSVYGEGRYLAPDGQRVGNVRRSIAQLNAHDWQPKAAGGETLEPVPTDESKPVDLASIYALTKYAQERAVLIFGEAYAMETVALRLFNVFGPGQALANPYTGVLANFASRLANGAAPTLFEDGLQKRDFVHVKDVARAFRLALEQPQAPGHTINIGSGRAYAIRDVALMLADAMEVDVAPEITGRFRSGDIRNCFADIAKARELLGFEPRYRLEHSLVELADWVRRDGAVDRGEEMRRHLESRGLVI